MPKPEISICCTVYNNRNRIRASLDSIICAPHFKERMEIVISENYSLDGTWEVLQEYARKHKNIIIFRAKCALGVGRAMAFERSSGKFVTTADLDTIYQPAHWDLVWNYAKACKENEIYLHGTFMQRRTMKRIGGWNRNLKGTEDTELYARAAAKYGVRLLALPVTTYENEVVKGRRILRYGHSMVKKYLHALESSTGIIMGGGLNFDEISARTFAETVIIRALYVWIKLTGKKIYRYAGMPNTDLVNSSVEILNPSKFGVSMSHWLYYLPGKPRERLNKNVNTLMGYGFDKILFTPSGVLMYSHEANRRLLGAYSKQVP